MAVDTVTQSRNMGEFLQPANGWPDLDGRSMHLPGHLVAWWGILIKISTSLRVLRNHVSSDMGAEHE